MKNLPENGRICTIFFEPIFRLCKIVNVEAFGTIHVRPEFSDRLREFTLRSDGRWVEKGYRGKKVPELLINLQRTNFSEFKINWSERELKAGPIEMP